MMTYGTNDLSMPIVQGPIGVAEDLKEAGNSDLVVRYYEGADHGSFANRSRAPVTALPEHFRFHQRFASSSPAQPQGGWWPAAPGIHGNDARCAAWFGSGDAMLAILISGCPDDPRLRFSC